MLLASKIILEYVCPGLGVLIGNAMFSAPVRSCYQRVVEGQGLQSLNPTPWAFMLGNCFGWVTYSVLIDDLWVFFGNAPGFCISFWLNLQAAKMQYETFRSNEFKTLLVRALDGSSSSNNNNNTNETIDASITQQRHTTNASTGQSTAKIIQQIRPEPKVAPAPHEKLVLLNVVVWLAIVALISFASASSSPLSDRTTQEWIVGIAVNLNLLVFYAAPLSTIWTVLSTQNSDSIHVPTMLTNTFNGLFWGAYGVAIFDWFIAAPNLIGAGLGVVQIVLSVLFPRRTKSNSETLESKAPEAAAMDANDEETPSKESLASPSTIQESNHSATESSR